MILSNKNYMDGYAILRYKATEEFSWQDAIDFMQCFFNDLDQVQMVQYAKNQKVQSLSNIHQGLLYLSDELKEEKEAIILAGHSEESKANIKMTIFTHTDIVDLQVIMRGNDYILGKFKNNDHVLDKYMNRLELSTMERKSIRYGINEYHKFLRNLNDGEIVEEFTELCEDCQIDVV